ncbi:hypothetical protein BKA81DRAFT_1759 [Phyllosticta paracitricarpa]
MRCRGNWRGWEKLWGDGVLVIPVAASIPRSFVRWAGGMCSGTPHPGDPGLGVSRATEIFQLSSIHSMTARKTLLRRRQQASRPSRTGGVPQTPSYMHCISTPAACPVSASTSGQTPPAPSWSSAIGLVCLCRCIISQVDAVSQPPAVDGSSRQLAAARRWLVSSMCLLHASRIVTILSLDPTLSGDRLCAPPGETQFVPATSIRCRRWIADADSDATRVAVK